MIPTKYFRFISIILVLAVACNDKDNDPVLPPPPPPPPPVTNEAPQARNITITGTANVSNTIKARYTYFDAENDPQNGTSFQWYIANDTTGAAITAVSNATDTSYTLQVADQNRFLRVSIIPKSSAGTSPGTEAKSSWIGPVGAPEPTSITFTYNGQMVTYGVITSAATGRKWLDRNLGAPNAPGAFDDWQNKGDLLQWGRKADGHQLINRAATTAGTTGVNGTTTTLATSDNPGHSLFIVTSAAPFDWRNPQNTGLWQVTGGVNNACPTGWHIPSKAEWEAENLGTVQDAYTKLKITTGGTRNFNDGSFSNTVNDGLYWTSSVFTGVSITPYSFNFSSLTGPAYSSTINVPANGLSVRCIKD
jgi:hypothetical protein